jgi:UDP-galactose transporter B1
MARIKQATPLRRDPSSEFISREDRSPRSIEKSNGTNGNANGSVLKALDPKKPNEAGVVQLLLAVGGIYGSLYVRPFQLQR